MDSNFWLRLGADVMRAERFEVAVMELELAAAAVTTGIPRVMRVRATTLRYLARGCAKLARLGERSRTGGDFRTMARALLFGAWVLRREAERAERRGEERR